MPPTKMTRQQYEAQYGVKPVVVTTSDFDTSPAPIRMTRAEYDATYRPKQQTYGQTFKQDIVDTGKAQQSALQQGIDRTQAIEQRVATGETSKAKGLFQKFGTGLLTASNIIGETVMGGAKAVLPDTVEAKIGETLGKDLEQIFAPETRQAFISKLKESEGGVLTSGQLDNKAGLFLEEVGNQYKIDPNFRADVQSAGGILSWLSLPGTARTAIVKTAETTSGLADAATPPLSQIATQIKENVPFTASPEKRVANQANDILNVESKYNTLRKINELDPKGSAESRTRIAQSNVLEGAVDDNGRINTTEAIKTYRAGTIDGYEDIVRKQLEAENSKVNLKELELDLKANILDSGLEGGSLYTALKGIEKQIKGLSVRADAFGDVPLYKLQDAKISEYKSLDYTKVNQATYKKALARTYKETIERKSGLPVKQVNAELAKYYKDIERLEKLNGKIVEGGKLGKYGASIVGTGVGMAGGSVFGGGGAAVGGMIGGEIAQRLKGKSMASTFSRGIEGVTPESDILKAAKTADVTNLKTPSAKVGVPTGITKTDEMVRVESLISKNVDMQKKAISQNDFTLVAELKTIYLQLVDKLKALIEDYKKNGPPIGMSIRKSITPESVAKKIDDEDFNRLVSIIEDPMLAKLDDATKRMISDMNLTRATDDELVTFAKQVTDEYELIQRNNPLMSDQKNAINPPTKAQSISDTVDNTDANVNGTSPQSATTQTNLLEEAKKYKSATKVYHGSSSNIKEINFDSIKEDSNPASGLGFFTTPKKQLAGEFGKAQEFTLKPNAKVLRITDEVKNTDESARALWSKVSDEIAGGEGQYANLTVEQRKAIMQDVFGEYADINKGTPYENTLNRQKGIRKWLVDNGYDAIEMPTVFKDGVDESLIILHKDALQK